MQSEVPYPSAFRSHLRPRPPTGFRVRRLPRPGPSTSERRVQRSSCPLTALQLALTCAAHRSDLDVVLIVDEAGLVVATSATDFDLSMLAAVTPIVGRGRAVPRIRRNGEHRDMSVRPVELLGELMYVAAVGGERRHRVREVHGTVAAFKRILA